MRIEIPDGHASTGRGDRKRGDGYLVEITEPHCLIARGVVAGWTHEGEGFLPGLGEPGCLQRGADGTAGMIVDPGEIRRVVVDIGGLLNAPEQAWRMGETQRRFVGDRRNAPRPIRMCLTKMSHAAGDASRLLRPHRGAIVSALRIVQNDHDGRPPTEERNACGKTKRSCCARLLVLP